MRRDEKNFCIVEWLSLVTVFAVFRDLNLSLVLVDFFDSCWNYFDWYDGFRVLMIFSI